MQLLYITYIDFYTDAKSGSSVRPKKMYNAFKQMGLDIKLLECQQNRYRERNKRVKECIEWLKTNTPDFCYIESPSGPIFNSIDRKLIKEIDKKGIPISYFYRDAFWLFPYMMSDMGFIKRHVITVMNKIDLKLLTRCCDTVYFPSQSVIDIFDFVNFDRTDILPPGTEERDIDFSYQNLNNTVIYVGAVSEVNGTFDLIRAMYKLNKEGKALNLILVCRENEWKKLNIKEDDIPNWLIIKHASEDELKKIYSLADLAIFPRKADEYLDIAVPVKLFEYISYGKPVVSTKRKEVKKFIDKEQFGILCDDGCDGICEAISLFYENEDLRKRLYLNTKNASENNLWIRRAEKVIQDFKHLEGK